MKKATARTAPGPVSLGSVGSFNSTLRLLLADARAISGWNPSSPQGPDYQAYFRLIEGADFASNCVAPLALGREKGLVLDAADLGSAEVFRLGPDRLVLLSPPLDQVEHSLGLKLTPRKRAALEALLVAPPRQGWLPGQVEVPSGVLALGYWCCPGQEYQQGLAALAASQPPSGACSVSTIQGTGEAQGLVVTLPAGRYQVWRDQAPEPFEEAVLAYVAPAPGRARA